MNPEKITFNPYKNEYEKILEIHRGNTKLSVLMFILGFFLGIIVSVFIIFQDHTFYNDLFFYHNNVMVLVGLDVPLKIPLV